jgi:hypothetical protein
MTTKRMTVAIVVILHLGPYTEKWQFLAHVLKSTWLCAVSIALLLQYYETVELS